MKADVIFLTDCVKLTVRDINTTINENVLSSEYYSILYIKYYMKYKVSNTSWLVFFFLLYNNKSKNFATTLS